MGWTRILKDSYAGEIKGARSMAIPDYQTLMLPVLEFAADGLEHPLREAVSVVADRLGLTPAERMELLPSGMQAVFTNRIAWARTYLKKAGLLDSPRRGTLRITDRGKQLVAEKPGRVDVHLLERFPEFVEFKNSHREVVGRVAPSAAEGPDQETPEEALERAHQALRAALAEDLLARVATMSPEAFERLVVELLVAMGYGGSRKDAGERIGQSGDGGIDGIIKEDRLGLDIIYIQAKRWQNPVGRPEIQKFVGALQGQRARKGVFITSSAFTRDAEDYVSRIDIKVVLIDGEAIANFMIDFEVGVSKVRTYAVKRVDSDYFDEA
jgi:restriction system protein